VNSRNKTLTSNVGLKNLNHLKLYEPYDYALFIKILRN